MQLGMYYGSHVRQNSKKVAFRCHTASIKLFLPIICNRPEHDILVLIAHAQKPRLNDHADISSGARGLNFGLSLHPYPYLVYASSECSNKHARMRMLVCALAARRSVRLENRTLWLLYLTS